MENIPFVLFVLSVPILIIILLLETKEYHKHRQAVKGYVILTTQFIAGFEAIKNIINFNADLQREVLEKVNAHSKNLIAIMTILDIHDRALGVQLTSSIMRELNEEILLPKKAEE